jgi:hypothetical protein
MQNPYHRRSRAYRNTEPVINPFTEKIVHREVPIAGIESLIRRATGQKKDSTVTCTFTHTPDPHPLPALSGAIFPQPPRQKKLVIG